jgi:hypothetical protein
LESVFCFLWPLEDMRKVRAGLDEDGGFTGLLKFNLACDSPLGD